MSGTHYYFYPVYYHHMDTLPSICPGFHTILDINSTELVITDDNYQLGCLSCLPQKGKKKKKSKIIKSVVKPLGFESGI